MRMLFILLMTVFITVSCSNRRANNEPGLLTDQTINIVDVSRHYHLYLPDSPTNASIVLLLHGNGGNADRLLGLSEVKTPYKQWLDIAKRENLILAIPDGTEGENGKRGWNDCRADAEGNPSSNDVLFLSELIGHIANTYMANSAQVFAVGTSNGGHMALRLAQEVPDQLAGIGVIAAANPSQSQCANAATPISVLIMNGTSDPLLPFEGGSMVSNRGEVFSAESTTLYWTDRNQTDAIPTVMALPNTNTEDESTITKTHYHGGNNNAQVVLYTVINGGHTEPSIAERYSNAYKRLVGNQNGDIEMAEEVWAFFSGLAER